MAHLIRVPVPHPSRIIEKLGDRWWRLNNLYYITDKFGRRVQFKLNEVQADLDDNLHTLNLALNPKLAARLNKAVTE